MKEYIEELEGHKLGDKNLLGRGKSIHAETFKGYGKLEAKKINKLTPLEDD